jgi:hypothetical protein
MKTLFAVLVLVTVFASFNTSVMAQTSQGSIFVVTTFERAFPKDGFGRELDSLSALYAENCFAKNEFIVSYKVMRHFWGHSNTDFIQMMEVKSWEDIEKANDKINELFMKAWPTQQDRKKFNDAYNKYFTGKHSDEIYSEVVAPK